MNPDYLFNDQLSLRPQEMHDQWSWALNYLAHLERQQKSTLTCKAYAQDLAHFFTWLTERGWRLEQMNPERMSQYLSHLSGEASSSSNRRSLWLYHSLLKYWSWVKGMQVDTLETNDSVMADPPVHYAPSSRRRILSALKMFFEYLRESDLISIKHWPQSPLRASLHQVKLKVSQIDHTPLLRGEHFEKLISLAPLTKSQKALYRLLYFGGLRVGEALALEWKDISWEHESVKITRKGGKVHFLKIFWPNEVFPALRDYWLALNEAGKNLNGSVFLGPPSKQQIHAQLKLALKQAGLPGHLSAHSFRRGCATILYQQTKDLLLVRDYLNHSDAKVTQTYIATTEF